MKNIIILFILSLLSFTEVIAQTEYIDYRSQTNPLYWKNRKPFSDYWQQDVHYNITASLNDSTDIITGHEELSYFNNSYGYDDDYAGNNYPNPYSDPNNPYYRKANTTDPSTNTTNDDFDYRKKSNDKPSEKQYLEKDGNQPNEKTINKTELDGTLPQSKLNDKELLKINIEDLDIE